MSWKKSFVFVILFVLIIVVFILISKKEKEYKSQEYFFKEFVWERPNIVSLTLEVTPNMMNQSYDLYLDLEHTIQIRKDMMQMDMEIIAPNKEERIATYNLWYKNNEGKFKGIPHENLFDLHQVLRKKFEFTQEGTWTFLLQQRSEFQYLQGIKSVQLVAIPSAKEEQKEQEQQ